jgi:hypothetical protein
MNRVGHNNKTINPHFFLAYLSIEDFQLYSASKHQFLINNASFKLWQYKKALDFMGYILNHLAVSFGRIPSGRALHYNLAKKNGKDFHCNPLRNRYTF